MGQHNYIVFGQMDVRLNCVSSNLDGAFESFHGVLRMLGFVTSMCYSLGEHSPGAI